MPRNSFIQMTKLHDVKGRIYYISSEKKQENLYAVYETTDRHFWTQLAKCNQEEFKKSVTEGKCIEARELIIALPESFVDYEPETLLELFMEHLKQIYGTECIAALHHNKAKTNYHIHLIFSERTLLEEPVVKIASRNMFYDEKGKHVRTTKEICDENGNLRKGCKIIKKGEIYEQQLFSVKDKRFKDERFLDEVKQDYTDYINRFVKDETQKLSVFERGGMYLAAKKIGKNNPKTEQIKKDNQMREKWNQTVDRAIITGVAKEDILQVKKEEISDKVAESVRDRGNSPNLLSSIIILAILALEHLITLIIKKNLDFAKTVIQADDFVAETKETFNKSHSEVDVSISVDENTAGNENTMPEESSSMNRLKPEPSEYAQTYPKMSDINDKLQKQNRAIFDIQKQRNELELELENCEGIFKAGKRTELRNEIDSRNVKIDQMSADLSNMVKAYGYKNMEEFITEYYKALNAYSSYKEELKEWEKSLEPAKPTLEDYMRDYEKNYDREWKDKSRGAR